MVLGDVLITARKPVVRFEFDMKVESVSISMVSMEWF